MPPDPAEMRRRGRIGALTTAGRYDGRLQTQKARETFIRSFWEQARAEALTRGETLTDDEARRRGEFLRRAWYARLVQRRVRRKWEAATTVRLDRLPPDRRAAVLAALAGEE